MKYIIIFTKMWGVYSLLLDTVTSSKAEVCDISMFWMIFDVSFLVQKQRELSKDCGFVMFTKHRFISLTSWTQQRVVMGVWYHSMSLEIILISCFYSGFFDRNEQFKRLRLWLMQCVFQSTSPHGLYCLEIWQEVDVFFLYPVCCDRSWWETLHSGRSGA